MTGITRTPRRSFSSLLLAALLGWGGGSSAVRADLMSYDSFSGTPGQALSGMDGGTGFAGAWRPGTLGPDDSQSYVVQGSSLSGGLMPSQGGRVASLAQYSLGGGLTRDLATPIGTPGSTVFISMLVRADGTLNEGTSGGFFGLLLNASTTTPTMSQDLFIGKTGSGGFGLEDRGGGNSHLSSTSPAIGVSYNLVVEADFASSGPDKFTLYVNPTNASMGEGVVKQDSELGLISSVSIYSTGAFSLDELRIGTSLGAVLNPSDAISVNVVPEPASVVMLGLAGLSAAVITRVRARLGR